MEIHISPAQAKELLPVIYELAIDGLETPGDHHKQWFLEEILKASIGEENYSQFWKEYTDGREGDELWEPGIAP